jgi:23S rRNA (pseudouridine1915-N3)-methyltransferase
MMHYGFKADFLQIIVYICGLHDFDPMKITLLTVGKTDKDWVKQGLDIYVSRLKHYIPFSIVEIPELKGVSALTKDQIKTREGELILKNIRPADDLILLDEHGKEYTSVEWAKILQDKISYTGKDMVFVIGGAYGFSEPVYKRANSKISLSRMTFSHQMVRAIFTEQLYRAFTIMKGEPYHHE